MARSLAAAMAWSSSRDLCPSATYTTATPRGWARHSSSTGRTPNTTRSATLSRCQGLLDLAHDGGEGLGGLGGVPDRTPDHQVIGARRDGAGRRGDPLLIAQRRAR